MGREPGAPARERRTRGRAAGGAAAKIRYLGRTAQQAESRERRRAILEATLRIIVREGMRGVRHRAIAREAGVPLAATTYYFKDLSDLIADAFNLYAEDTLRETQDLERGSLAALAQYAPGDLPDPGARAELARALERQLVAHVGAQVRRRDARILEHAFRNEALRNEKLAAIAQVPHARTLASIADFLERCGTSDPESDARLIFGCILELEYEMLVGAADLRRVERSVRRLVGHVLGVPQR